MRKPKVIPKEKKAFSFSTSTLKVLDRLKQGIIEAHPNAKRMHSRTFAMTLAIHRVANMVDAGDLTYNEFFDTDIPVPGAVSASR